MTLAEGAERHLHDHQHGHRAQLTLQKIVDNGATGGTAVPADFTLRAVNGASIITGPGNSAEVTNQIALVGTYTLSETPLPGYDPSTWICTGGASSTGNSVTLAAGGNATCTITNTAIAPRLTLVKVVANGDSDATTPPTAWDLSADGPVSISGPVGDPDVTAALVQAGSYDLSEDGPSGYDPGDWTCSGSTSNTDDSVTLEVGDNATCTITNTVILPQLTLHKIVDNGDTGATKTPADFTLTAENPGSTPSRATISGPGNSAAVTAKPANVGTYDLSELTLPGYTASAWDCNGSDVSTANSVTLEPGDETTCTITNTAIAPRLTLVKHVDNANTGATTPPTAWTLTATGPTTISGSVGQPAVTAAPVQVGSYTLTESGPAGYGASAWTCTGATSFTGTSVTLAEGQNATCEITNTAQPAHLTLQKIVDANESGSGKKPADWTLTADPNDIPGQQPVTGNGDPTSAGGVNAVQVLPGGYTLSESGPAGFDAGNWECQGGVLDGTSVQVPLGGNVICQITNKAISPQLTLVKVVDNGDTGVTTPPTAWTLVADGPTPISGRTGSASVTAAPVKVGSYALSESGPSGYQASSWTCTGAQSSTAASVTLAEGQHATCTIRNTAIPATWTLKKTADPPSGTTVPVDSVIKYTLTAAHASGVAVIGATAEDDLSEVLPYATIVQPLPAELTLSGTTLTWAIPDIDVGSQVSVSFSVKVMPDAAGVTVHNVAAPTSPGGECGEAAPDTAGRVRSLAPVAGSPCETIHDTPPTWTLTKTANPPSGTSVKPGSTIAYTLTATNTSKAPVTGATAQDDLSKVLSYASLVTPLPAGLTQTGTKLTWTIPTIPVGGKVSVTFSVIVHTDAAGVTITNLATPTSPGGACSENCETTHKTPTWTLAKTANPASGTEVQPGSTIAYTLTATNTSQAAVSGATAQDDLSKVLSYASLVTPLPAGLTQSGTKLTWTIPTIPVGGKVSVTFKVTVNTDAIGVTISNLATPTSPGGKCTSCQTTHTTPPTWTLNKTADPASGSTVSDGQTITYTLTAANTGSSVVSGAVATDDLSQLAAYVYLNTPLPAGLTRSGDTLTWAIPDIPVGGQVSVEFSVVVGQGFQGITITNLATPASPGGSCLTCRTDHHVPTHELPNTGVPVDGFLQWAFLLLAAGGLLVFGGRRRRSTGRG